MEENKVYRASLELGSTTDTQDSEGRVLSTADSSHLDRETIAGACRSMIGSYAQVPPMYSALKKDGVPLYKLARQGKEVERQARAVTIYALDILEIDPPRVTFEVRCSKGTYVRTICHDIGQRLGVGAHLTDLRRIASAPFCEDDAVTLDAIENTDPALRHSFLLSLEEALRDYPSFLVAPEGVKKLSFGIPPQDDMVPGGIDVAEGTIVLLISPKGPLAMARYAPSRERETRGDFELLRVFNDAGGFE
jgi:tRNA pseudouridine55 synthase